MYAILSTSTTIGWLVLMIILLLIEIPTVGLTTIWGVVGAFIAMLLSMVGVPIVAQFIVFFVVTVLLLYYTRPWALKHLNNKVTKTNKDKLIGQIIKVTETVDNINQTGSGNVNDVSWTLRTKDNSVIPAGSLVKVLEISGVKLIVERYMEDASQKLPEEPVQKEIKTQSDDEFDDFDDDLDDTDDFI